MGAGTSAMANPDAGPPAAKGPYGLGAWEKISCQVSAFAGRITMVSLGTVTTCPLTLIVPPQCAFAMQVESSVASWMKPVISNCVDAGIGSCAQAWVVMASRLRSRTPNKRVSVLLWFFVANRGRLWQAWSEPANGGCSVFIRSSSLNASNAQILTPLSLSTHWSIAYRNSGLFLKGQLHRRT